MKLIIKLHSHFNERNYTTQQVSPIFIRINTTCIKIKR